MKRAGNGISLKSITQGEKEMATFLNVIKIIVIVIAALFALTFTVYIFNLDMKLTAAIYPWLNKQYDKVKRDQHL
jgi:hypothetical protein